jgi:predicted ATP-grasp superfamily ATP-dependent carboligase
MLPQFTRNVRVTDKEAVLKDEGVVETVRRISDRLGRNGRILMWPSGT